MPEEQRDVGRRDVLEVLDGVDLDQDLGGSSPEWTVERLSDGVNEVFVVSDDDGHRVVLKFGTFAEPDHLRAGVIACRVLGTYTELPVPETYATDLSASPPVVVMEYLPGEPLADGFDDTANLTDPERVRLLGRVLDALADVPDHGTEGYGTVREYGGGETPRAVCTHEDCARWFLEYAGRLYSDSPDDDRLSSLVSRVEKYLQANADRFRSAPPGAFVFTDFSPQNLLAPGGTPPEDLDGLTGVYDLERAKVAPVEFAAVNLEHLLVRDLSDPTPVQEALYEPLPFGPDLDRRDLYRLVAIGRSVGALEFWYEPGTEEYRKRRDDVSDAIEAILEV